MAQLLASSPSCSAKLLDVKLGNRKTTAIINAWVVEVAGAIIGLIIMILMFRALYAA